MEIQKIVNLLNGSDNENSKFATKKWYVIDSESKCNYSDENKIKFLTSSLESNHCDYSDAYILVSGNINVTGGNANAKVAFKNCDAQHINIAIHMYNLIECSDNYSDISGRLWECKRGRRRRRC